jgi:hypothetical protein
MAIRRNPHISAALLSAVGASLSGCVYGFLYQDTVMPLTKNPTDVPVATVVGEGSTVELQEPFSGYGLRVEWGSHRGLGDVAQRRCVDLLSHGDIRRERILGGVWKRTTVTVYGQKSLHGERCRETQ